MDFDSIETEAVPITKDLYDRILKLISCIEREEEKIADLFSIYAIRKQFGSTQENLSLIREK